MSKFSQRYKCPVDGPEAFAQAVKSFAKQYPETAAMLSGEVDTSGNWETPPFGVRLFINGGEFKFCISRPKEKLSGFGLISNPLNILESIEEALSEGKIGWKQDSEQNIPY